MTRFWREGFHRTSVNGYTHWVEGHWVDRDGWGGGSHSASRSYFAELLRDARASRTATASFVNPNAECPVCGAQVFFYRNEFGSQVYFDELGPPWPKHPCTDGGAFARSPPTGAAPHQSTQPAMRSEDEISAIRYWQGAARTDPAFSFQIRYSQKPWSRVRVARRLKIAGGTLLAVLIAKDADEHEAFLRSKLLPRFLKEGSVAFLKGKTLSFFDITTMEPREVAVERVKSLSAVVRLLLK